jgi:hypothetical protein
MMLSLQWNSSGKNGWKHAPAWLMRQCNDFQREGQDRPETLLQELGSIEWPGTERSFAPAGNRQELR